MAIDLDFLSLHDSNSWSRPSTAGAHPSISLIRLQTRFLLLLLLPYFAARRRPTPCAPPRGRQRTRARGARRRRRRSSCCGGVAVAAADASAICGIQFVTEHCNVIATEHDTDDGDNGDSICCRLPSGSMMSAGDSSNVVQNFMITRFAETGSWFSYSKEVLPGKAPPYCKRSFKVPDSQFLWTKPSHNFCICYG